MSDFNTWGVAYSIIQFLERALRIHRVVQSFERTEDILFEVQRKNSLTTVYILCLDEYALGLAAIHRALDEFPICNCISVGGNWNGYTPQAKEFCLENSIGLFTTSELLGALWHQNFWTYSQKDEKGNPEYPYRVA